MDIFAHINSCKDQPELVGVSTPCRATNFSSHGLNFTSELSIPPGSFVYITICFDQPFSQYLLLCEVRWEFDRDGKLSMGLQFSEGEHSDLNRWIEEFDTHFQDESATD